MGIQKNLVCFSLFCKHNSSSLHIIEEPANPLLCVENLAGDSFPWGDSHIKGREVPMYLQGLKMWFCYLLGCTVSKGPQRTLSRKMHDSI